MTVSAARTIEKAQPLTIFQRIAAKDKTAVKDCVDAYGNFIWALARKFTRSPEEAAAATREIFIDIWRYAEHGNPPQSVEDLTIRLIARRRLIEYLRQAGQKSMSGIDTTNEQGAGTDGISKLIPRFRPS